MSGVVPHLIFGQRDEPCICRKPKEGEIYGSAHCRAFGGGWTAEPPVGRVDDDLDAGENSRLPVVTGQKKSDG